MISTETIVPGRKLKIKFSTKKVEVDPGVKCEFGQQGVQIDENGCRNSKQKPSMPDSTKRGPPGSIEAQKEKRQKIDRRSSMQCGGILKSLFSHPYSWVFSTPVDPVALNIPDYFSIISQPMDLGTIKSKLEKNIYFGIEEFAADVRLTFSNAMTYNPPSNDVHLMAKELNKVFNRKWKDFNKKWKCEGEDGKSMTGAIKETVRRNFTGTHPRHTDTLPKKSLLSEHEGIQKISSLAARDSNVEVRKLSQTPCKLIKKDLHKVNNSNRDGKHPSGSVRDCPSLPPVTCKCGLDGHITCSCVIPNNSTRASSDISYEGSEGGDLIVRDSDALRLTKCTSPLQRKSDPDSDGVVSSLDSEHMCSSSQVATLATDATSGEVWSTPDFTVQLSPKKALRAAMLKKRFADTILKAQQKTLLENGDKVDPMKMQLEKERLERIQREERARIEAQIKTAEATARMRAEEESRQRREKEREAARAAIEKMERTVEIEHNMEIIEELEILSGCRLSYKAVGGRNGYRAAIEALEKPQLENPLERLGLFIKDEDAADEDEEVLNAAGCEEGEIF